MPEKLTKYSNASRWEAAQRFVSHCSWCSTTWSCLETVALWSLKPESCSSPPNPSTCASCPETPVGLCRGLTVPWSHMHMSPLCFLFVSAELPGDEVEQKILHFEDNWTVYTYTVGCVFGSSPGHSHQLHDCLLPWLTPRNLLLSVYYTTSRPSARVSYAASFSCLVLFFYLQCLTFPFYLCVDVVSTFLCFHVKKLTMFSLSHVEQSVFWE